MDVFENAICTLGSRADDFVRWYIGQPELLNAETGHADEWTYGWIGKAHVISVEIAQYVSQEGDPWASMNRNIPTGYYLFQQTASGMVWAYYYGPDTDPKSLNDWNRDFEFAEIEFSSWYME